MQLTKINGKYELWLPEHRAARDQWETGWEVKRIDAMVECLHTISKYKSMSFIGQPDKPKYTPVLFDIGTEEGDISALLVKEAGCDIVMFEPNDRVWSCINAIWEGNRLKKPLDFYGGFISNVSKIGLSENGHHFGEIKDIERITGELIPDHGFKQLYENYPDVPQIKLDDYCQLTGIYPDVITMDVEGAEFEVIKGAEKTLREKKPVIFMSVHPEFMYESYRNEGIWKELYGERQHVVHMLRFIDELGYTHECIEYDYHELHMKFIPK